jgi:hypothetical protein
LPTPSTTNVTSNIDVGATASARAAIARLTRERGTLVRSDSRWSLGAPASIVAIAATDKSEYSNPRRLSVSEWCRRNSRTRITQKPQNCPKLQ